MILAKLLARIPTPAKCEDIPLDADNEDQLGLSRDVEGAILLGSAGKTNLLALTLAVLLDVLLSTLEDDTTLLLVVLQTIVSNLSSHEMVISECHDSIRPERWYTSGSIDDV